MDEKELVRKAKSGDFDAFAKLVDTSKGRIFALARKMTGNDQDAEDILQETLLKAIDKIDQFRGEAVFGSWLYSIALNQARQHLGREHSVDLKPIEEYLSTGEAGDTHRNSGLFDWRDPHALLENEELSEIIDEAVGELPVKYREAFLQGNTAKHIFL
jgi:RNA polymerase sigma-70 factor (ECF subfamily)